MIRGKPFRVLRRVDIVAVIRSARPGSFGINEMAVRFTPGLRSKRSTEGGSIPPGRLVRTVKHPFPEIRGRRAPRPYSSDPRFWAASDASTKLSPRRICSARPYCCRFRPVGDVLSLRSPLGLFSDGAGGQPIVKLISSVGA